ncbi:hypothetical protein [Pararhizobium sp. IMCC21322]|uniref:hypothetical protein n=1 Tax=Pararhizobium sp. IMCC21322 TaxID=3067903 RepID=UPI002740B253|nr:hypothetical protein [Pararhizobium sp. IMCC21322]
MTIQKRNHSIPLLAPFAAAMLFASVSSGAMAQSLDADVSTDDGVSASVSAGGTGADASASTGGSNGGTNASANVSTGGTNADVNAATGADGTNANVNIGAAGATGDVNVGTGADGTNANVSVGVGNATGDVNASTGGGSIEANVSVQQANEIGSLSNLNSQQISATLTRLGSSETAILRQKCDSILAAPSSYSAEAVQVCKVIIAL